MKKKKGLSGALNRKVGFGRLVFPAWSVVLAATIIGAAAGQAIGPLVNGISSENDQSESAQGQVMSPSDQAPAAPTVVPFGSSAVMGEVGATVSQAITLDTENLSLVNRVTVIGATDGIGATNDDGTHFTVAYETHVGDTVEIRLNLLNRSQKDAVANMVLKKPAGFNIAASGDGTLVRMAQVASDTWLMTVASNTAAGNGYVAIRLKSRADERPGFFQLSGHIVQVAG